MTGMKFTALYVRHVRVFVLVVCVHYVAMLAPRNTLLLRVLGLRRVWLSVSEAEKLRFVCFIGLPAPGVFAWFCCFLYTGGV